MSEGRGVNGRFAAGNRIGSGNPGNKRMAELRLALLDSTTPEQVKELIAALHRMAIGGDVSAAKVWLEFTIGKPVQAVEVSGPDGGTIDFNALGDALVAAFGGDMEARIKVADAFRRLAMMNDPPAGPMPDA